MPNELAAYQFLSFRTSDKAKSACDVQGSGAELLKRFGAAMKEAGFTIDYAAGKGESDWLFAAHDTLNLFGVGSLKLVLVWVAPEPCDWFVYLQEENGRALESPKVRGELNPVLQKVVAEWPGASKARWHFDWTTLREISLA